MALLCRNKISAPAFSSAPVTAEEYASRLNELQVRHFNRQLLLPPAATLRSGFLLLENRSVTRDIYRSTHGTTCFMPRRAIFLLSISLSFSVCFMLPLWRADAERAGAGALGL